MTESPRPTYEMQRQALIAQGARYRVQAAESVQAVRSSLRGDVLARTAFGHLRGNAAGILAGSLSLMYSSQITRRLVTSLLFSGLSLVGRKGRGRGLARTGLLLGAIGTIFFCWTRPSSDELD